MARGRGSEADGAEATMDAVMAGAADTDVVSTAEGAATMVMVNTAAKADGTVAADSAGVKVSVAAAEAVSVAAAEAVSAAVAEAGSAAVAEEAFTVAVADPTAEAGIGNRRFI